MEYFNIFIKTNACEKRIDKSNYEHIKIKFGTQKLIALFLKLQCFIGQ